MAEGRMTIFVGPPVDRLGRPERCQNAPACSGELVQSQGKGRPRLYCRDACRFAAWARRERVRVLALAGPNGIELVSSSTAAPPLVVGELAVRAGVRARPG